MTFREYVEIENKTLQKELDAAKERLRFWQTKVEFLEKQYASFKESPLTTPR